MRKHPGMGVWEIFIPGVGEGALYKYEIIGPKGDLLPLKADPFGFRAERLPGTASVVHDPSRYEWGDSAWMEGRDRRNALDAPMAVYEVHLGSWRRNPDGSYYTYRELADELVAYVVEMGYTHVEFLPPTEHPFDGSWGYQPLGLFAPTSRFGTPDDFMRLSTRSTGPGIGVLIDWVPAHFPEDPHGLALFDGTHLYEHADPRQGEHPDWGTLVFNYGRNEVRNFLISNALFWLSEYHVDGLRVDAVASMLYLDYSREPGEWVPNVHGGNENLEAVSFLKRTNELVYGGIPAPPPSRRSQPPGPWSAAPSRWAAWASATSGTWAGCTTPCSTCPQDPIHRKYHHDELTFSLALRVQRELRPAALPRRGGARQGLAHRQDAGRRVAEVRQPPRLLRLHVRPSRQEAPVHGRRVRQSREWNHDTSLDWHLLEGPMHRGVQTLIKDLNALYKATPALYEVDFEPAGFGWIDGGDRENSVVSFLRRGRAGRGPRGLRLQLHAGRPRTTTVSGCPRAAATPRRSTPTTPATEAAV